jgi:hypothetical protein
MSAILNRTLKDFLCKLKNAPIIKEIINNYFGNYNVLK